MLFFPRRHLSSAHSAVFAATHPLQPPAMALRLGCWVRWADASAGRFNGLKKWLALGATLLLCPFGHAGGSCLTHLTASIASWGDCFVLPRTVSFPYSQVAVRTGFWAELRFVLLRTTRATAVRNWVLLRTNPCAVRAARSVMNSVLPHTARAERTPSIAPIPHGHRVAQA